MEAIDKTDKVIHQKYLASYTSWVIKKYRYNNDKTQCPRGEIGRHKGLKILALLGVPVRVWPRAPKKCNRFNKKNSVIFMYIQKYETDVLINGIVTTRNRLNEN